MRYLVLSDVHSNLEALQACLERGSAAGFDRILCCGDIVGYGPNPREVMDLMDRVEVFSIRGNHDRVAAGLGDPTQFNPAARLAILWTQSQLNETYRLRLAALPRGPVPVTEEAQLVHGSARDEDAYVTCVRDARGALETAAPAITFFGHTHEPGVFAANSIWAPPYSSGGKAEMVLPKENVLVNPGSVGQPRDGDPRAAFLVWDEVRQSLEFYREAYDYEETQRKMRRAGLPDLLIYRLAAGR
jgi:predicted phosphodiesterase